MRRREMRRRDHRPATVKMIVDSFYIPKDNPSKPHGEDAHFFHKGAQVIGVADGVSRSSKNGIDAGEYARQLMSNAEFAVDGLRPGEVDPKQILVESFYRTEALGSSTACIVTLSGDHLVAANVGDSGFLLMRGGTVFYKSPVQQHRFNCPYQLGKGRRTGPEVAMELEMRVQRGDVLVVGSDGLFDNLFEREIATIVNDCLSWDNLPEDLARAALSKTSPLSNAGCPFQVAMVEHQKSWEKARGEDDREIKLVESGEKGKARGGGDRETKYDYVSGPLTGKYDDITVVVAHIVPECPY